MPNPTRQKATERERSLKTEKRKQGKRGSRERQHRELYNLAQLGEKEQPSTELHNYKASQQGDADHNNIREEDQKLYNSPYSSAENQRSLICKEFCKTKLQRTQPK
ncbi:hypothetical protein MRB53_023169 [Persea americana]|uniref:Uncharacterized protein n=1 Tax=Persea americana TaxID=3435 RepID=A0ACC2L8M4_PERAE|nr:hypothetical protein MRB53_023169 [Persea americana]